MKTLLRLLALCSIVLPLSAHADIYRCIVRHTVTYQDTPCANADESEIIVASIKSDRIDAERQPSASGVTTDITPDAQPDLSANISNLAPELMIGMFDTQVLNLRGWGRPAKITRSKAKGAWREEWSYVSPRNGE
ncbi:MAG TPA: DUF4124 domain-containing protein, partial [Burkholderiales bacterium]|nr:DUF4124 domain-containing protein [Burkholderiales bacterium]